MPPPQTLRCRCRRRTRKAPPSRLHTSPSFWPAERSRLSPMSVL